MEAPIQQDQTEVQTATTAVPQTTEIPEGSQPQSVAPDVDNGVPTSREPEWQQANFETARQIKNLMKEIRSLKQSFETRSVAPAQEAPKTQYSVTQDALLKDPLNGIGSIARTEAQAVEQRLMSMLQEQKYNQALQEGNRLIDTNDLVAKDPMGREKIDEILLKEDQFGNSLQKYSMTNPIHAAQLALNEYRIRYGNQRSAAAPSKAQMASTATAQTAGAGKSTSEAEIKSLWAQINENPDLTKDPKFMAQIDAVLQKSGRESLTSK